jgi:polyisoprenoid-binding protein YceI
MEPYMTKLSLRAVMALALGTCVLPTSFAQGAETAATPVAVQSGKATLSPENTHLQFVCAHRRADKPDPRTGTFTKFGGQAEVDAASKSLKSLSLDIETNSVSTEFKKLTDHLKGPDFFDTREHPKASFKSTKVTAGAKPGEYTITGDLTLHGVTKSIKAPATVSFSDGGFTVNSKFAIDRSEFGMTNLTENVENTVSLTFIVGQKNKVLANAGN